ncbi:uncharacterized protein I206_104675 [Kwoniella pini CBS 10737]
MLRKNGSNEYITTQDKVDEMEDIIDNFWNSSISWTEQKGSWIELNFIGNEIWIYGINGPSYSNISFNLDEKDLGNFSQEIDEIDYHHLIFELHNLNNTNRILKLTNLDQGKRMSFDYAIINNSEEIISSSKTKVNSEISTLTNTKELAAQITTSLSISSTSTITNSTITSSANDLNFTTNRNSTSLENSTQTQAQAQAAAAAASSAALAALLPTQYSIKQLSSLKEIYEFKWNSAAYFVIIFSSCVIGIFILFIIHISLKSYIKKNKPSQGYLERDEQHKVEDQSGMRIGNPINVTKNGQVDF